jgi:uncharacterized NAD(P)/FAD-binding protein YdhS
MRIAIIGGGPRGLGALEALAALGLPCDVTVFEPHQAPGAGPVYDPAQSPLNLLNLPTRAVDIGGGALGRSFSAWLGPGFDPDDFPARAAMGGYLAARFGAAATRLGARVVPAAADALARDPLAGGWRVSAGGLVHGPFDAAVLAIGHQPAQDDPQIAAWRAHARAHDGLTLAPAYPAEALAGVVAPEGPSGGVVALRGFGLAALDVLRALTEGVGGTFSGEGWSVYRPSGREPRLVPFSRDGMPQAPKPADAEIDALFELDPADREACARALTAACADADLAPLKAALAAAAARFCARFAARAPGRHETRAEGRQGARSGLAAAACRAWLAREFDGAGPQPRETVATARLVADYISMAEGRRAPSAGYALGQAMRRLQPALRAARPRTPAAARAILALDAGLKRYSFGPPVQAARRLFTLTRAGIVTLRQVDDPDVTPCAAGWRLTEGDADADVARAMIDTVLPGPDPARAAAPLVAQLLAAGLVRPWAEGLGLEVDPAGGAIGADGDRTPGLAVLGRLATGRRLGADSLHDCFGPSAAAWAFGVAGGRRAA